MAVEATEDGQGEYEEGKPNILLARKRSSESTAMALMMRTINVDNVSQERLGSYLV